MQHPEVFKGIPRHISVLSSHANSSLHLLFPVLNIGHSVAVSSHARAIHISVPWSDGFQVLHTTTKIPSRWPKLDEIYTRIYREIDICTNADDFLSKYASAGLLPLLLQHKYSQAIKKKKQTQTFEVGVHQHRTRTQPASRFFWMKQKVDRGSIQVTWEKYLLGICS